MNKTHNNVASFVLRFTQALWQDTQGEPHVQWRGHIRHVQGDEEGRFTDFAEAVAFIQHTLTQLTLNALPGGSPMSQEKVIRESFKLWEQFASSYSEMMFQAMEQAFKQSEAFRDQMKEVKDQALKAWQFPAPSEQAQILQALAELKAQLQTLAGKVEHLEQKLQEISDNAEKEKK
jgi:hypothetical protein